MCGGSEAWSNVHGMLETFAKNFKLFEIPAELKTTIANNLRTPANSGRTPAHAWQTFGA